MGKPHINYGNNDGTDYMTDPNFVSRGQRIQSSIKEFDRCACQCQFKDVSTKPDPVEEAKKAKKLYKYKKIFAKFAENTTAHGFGQIMSTKHMVLKLIWAAIILGTFTILCFTIQPLFEKYLSKPTVTKIKVLTSRQPKFPAIVICNENMVKDKMYKELLGKLGESENSIEQWEAMAKTEERFFYGHQVNETITQCSIHDRKDCTPTGDRVKDAEKGWTVAWDWRYGLCHAFNTGTDGKNGTVPIHRSQRIGPLNGIKMHININQKDYRPNTDTAGIRLYIGDQGLYYNMETHGISIGPGHSYDAVIKKQVIKRVDPFENNTCMRDSPTTIINHNTRKPIVYTKYSSYLCESLCAAKTIAERCGCVEYSLPLHHTHRDLEMCNALARDTCVENILRIWDHGQLECSESCTHECEEIRYTLQVASQDFPSSKKREEMINTTGEDPRENLLRITFFYKEMEYDSIEDELYYGISNLFADIGGQMGLFNGVSFLTVFEFLFLVLYVIGFSMFTFARGG